MDIGSGREWADSVWKRVADKMEKVAVRSMDKLPYSAVCGVHDDRGAEDIAWWTNGFWPGMMWLLYADTGRPVFKTAAEHAERLLEGAFARIDDLHHDVGFMFHLSYGMDYRLTGSEAARVRAFYAANLLAGRFNCRGGYLRAWNDHTAEENTAGWTIIDTMMNLPLLYRASCETGDRRYAYIAQAHADKTMRYHVRPDGSVRHIVAYDPENGEWVGERAGQGYAVGSSWSRGQAWGIYGFALSYLYTGDERYLNTALKIARYFIDNVRDDYLPKCDFRAPKEPVIYDSTAGVIAACGLLELAARTPKDSGAACREAAVRLLEEATARFVDFDASTDPLLLMGTERYHGEKGRHIPIIYGDFFYLEAISKLRGSALSCW